MGLNAFKKIQAKDVDVNFIQDNIAAYLQQLTNNPLLSGQLISSIVLTMGNNPINHKLGRVYQGWIVTSMNAGITLYEISANTNNAATLILNASAPATISVWVF